MPLDSRGISAKIPEESLGTLAGCLVEGDPEQRNRKRRVRRRSLIISILVQATVLASLILIPLFGKTERIAFAIATPVPPYSPYKGPPRDPGRPHDPTRRQHLCRFCVPTNIPPIIVTHDPAPTGDDLGDTSFDGSGAGIPGASIGLIPIPDTRTSVQEQHTDHRTALPTILHKTHIDPAMLIHRVEPVYPPLAIQIHKEGRVELRAIIATDGTIQSLEVVSGDPLFYQSAKAAVSQWLYRPTVLNGQRVEVDTYITVIYTMPH